MRIERIFFLGWLGLASTLAVQTCVGASEDWPGWRGVGEQGVSNSPGPLEWSDEENVAWKTKLPGEGHSSPVVVADKVFVTAARPTKYAPVSAAQTMTRATSSQ